MSNLISTQSVHNCGYLVAWKFYIQCTTLTFLLLVISCGPNSKPTNTEKPLNVIFIMADDLGYETIGANGGTSYQTPEINRLASDGMRFEHCYAQPLCTPTRVQLMTGIYNVRNYISFGSLDKSQTTFGHLFKNAGYTTCIAGKWQLGKEPTSPQHAGFDKHCLWQIYGGRADSTGRDHRYSKPVLSVDGNQKTFAETDYAPKLISEYGLKFIEESHEAGKPFFLYYPMILTHVPFSPTPDSPEWLTDDTAIMSYEGDTKYFPDMVSYMDKIVGEINRKLEELGIQENTIIVFTGDNGTEGGFQSVESVSDLPVVSFLNGRKVLGAKGKSTDAGTRVPLIVKWPSVVKPGTVNNDLIDFSDFLPTITEAAGIDLPSNLDIDGQSFLPLLRGESGHPREWIYSWYSRHGDVKNARVFARNKRYKLYESGEFYEIPKDYDELNSLEYEILNDDAKAVYKRLNGVIDKYKKQRLNKIPDSTLINIPKSQLK